MAKGKTRRGKQAAESSAKQPDPLGLTNHINWPANAVERWALDRIKPSPRNARLHSDAQIAQIAASMKEFGWTIPLLVAAEDDDLIAGHGRLLAARTLGWTEGPVMVARGWSDEQKRAYRIADNKLALNSEWDPSILSFELEALKLADFPVDLIGFDDVDMQRLADDLDRLRLDSDTSPEGDTSNESAGADGDTPDENGLLPFSVAMTEAARGVLFEAIARMKERDKLDNTADALERISREWIDAQSVHGVSEKRRAAG